MISNKKPNSPFIPLTAAISDTFLQMRAKPLIFLAVWLLFLLLPLLLFYFPFYQNFEEIPDSGVMRDNFGAQLALTILMILVISALYIYQYSVLADVIARLRKKLPPKFARSLSGGLRRFWGLLKVSLASGIRILIEPVIIMILGTVIAALLGQATLIYGGLIILTFISYIVMLFINLLRYSLAPYVHLSLGTGWRSSLAASKTYYRAHRLRVLVLFGFVILLSLVIFTPFSLVFIIRTRSIALGGLPAEEMITAMMGDPSIIAINTVLAVLQSIVMFFIIGVLINFGMNNFIPESSDEGGDDSRQVEAPS